MQGNPLSDRGAGLTKARVLLLQGPVGPFFSELADALTGAGHEVRRIGFNIADGLFGSRHQSRFKDGFDRWPQSLSGVLDTWRPHVVVLFGSSRPGHIVARKACADRNIPVLSLEEGYVRPGFVTAEWGGNNADSPLAGKMPDSCSSVRPPAGQDFAGFASMARYAAAYYTLRTILSDRSARSFFHRPINIAQELLGWGRNACKSVSRPHDEEVVIKRLTSIYSGKFFLVPLQVPTDANLQGAACGWTTRRLVDSTLASFAQYADPDARLVFKIHPMARGHGNTESKIRSVAAGNGIADRVDVLEGGALGHLAQHCAGMITINSTSGLSAISHGCPLLVVGNAVYASEVIATCAAGRPDFDSFWSGGFVASESLRHSFLAWLCNQSLLPGDFYASQGRVMAIQGVLDKLASSLRDDHPIGTYKDQ